MGYKKNENKNKSYYCKKCDFSCSYLSDFTRHLNTAKHKMVTNGLIKNESIYVCECGKEYKFRQGLTRHRQSCKLVKKNENFIDKLVTQHNTNNTIIKDLTDKISSMSLVTQTQNNIQNNTQNNFNLQFFLNEQCKDAIDLKTFLDQIIITLEDIMIFANSTYNNGMKSIIDRTFGAIDIYKRPLHCTDLKRNVFLSKLENGSWDKNKGNEQIKYVIKEISNKTTDYIHKKCSEYVHDVDSEEFNWYIGLAKIVMAIDESLGCYTNTIMKYISEKVHLDKKTLSGREAPI